MVTSITTLQRGSAAFLMITREEVENRYDTETLCCLADAISVADRSPGVRAIVITGSGSVFCAGGAPGKSRAEREAFGPQFTRTVSILAQCTKPVVAAVNGRCTAGGMMLLEASDFAITVPSATFGFPEILAGAFPLLALATAPSHLPKKLFFDMAYNGRLLDANEALDFGLVNRVVKETVLFAEVDRIVTDWATRPAVALTRGRRLYYTTVGAPRTDALVAASAALIDAAPVK